MELNAQTKIGLSFGQILSLITITGVFVMGYANLDMRINQMELKAKETEKMIMLNNTDIEKVRVENRQDHTALGVKIDQILLLQTKDKK